MPRAQASESRLLSCTPCRESKVRCVWTEPSTQSCQRCTRKDISCIRLTSKRRFTTSKDVIRENSTSNGAVARSSLANPIRPSSQDRSTTPYTDGDTSAIADPGLPSLSNPYKFLAQASHVVEQDTIFSLSHHQTLAGVSEPSDLIAEAVETSDVARWRASFSAGVYTPRIEPRKGNDPVSCGFLSASRAAALFHTYMDQYNDGNVLLDPIFHTFEYVSQHSFLSSSLYLIVARQEVFEGTEEISDQLDDHIRNKLLPMITLGNYRSVEIVIGLQMLSTFYFSTQYIHDDQSWPLLGQAIRISTELDLNSRIVSKALKNSSERVVRNYRAQERTWMNVYLLEQALASQTGRRPCLTYEGVVEDSQGWHLLPYSFSGDVAVVALIQLRRTYNGLRFLFNRLCTSHADKTSSNKPTPGLLERDLIYFLRRVQEEFQQWFEQYRDSDITSIRASRFRLYLNHCKTMLFSLPLQNSTGGIESAKQTISSLYEATVAYLSELTGSHPLHRLGRGHNSIFINGCYVAVMALKLSTLANRLSWIDVDYLFELVQRTSEIFCREWRGPKRPHKVSSEAYGEYIKWLLERYRRQSAKETAFHPTMSDKDEIHTTSTGVTSQSNDSQVEAPFFFLPQNIDSSTEENAFFHPQTEATELWSDHVAFSNDNEFLSWAQRFLNDSGHAQ